MSSALENARANRGGPLGANVDDEGEVLMLPRVFRKHIMKSNKSAAETARIMAQIFE